MNLCNWRVEVTRKLKKVKGWPSITAFTEGFRMGLLGRVAEWQSGRVAEWQSISRWDGK
jgi:hypothetical protein